MTGLYVDRWRVGTHSEREVDELLSFCDNAAIEDIYLHNTEDIAVSDNWDYIGYTLANAGKKRVHLWLSLTLGRDNQFTRDKAEDIKLVLDPKSVTTSKEADQGTVLSLNPESDSVKAYLSNRITQFIVNYPTLYGIHLDKLDEKSEQLVTIVRALAPTKYLSMTVALNKNFHQSWIVDERIPLIIGFTENQLDKDFSGFRSVALGCFSCNLAKTTERIRKIKEEGLTPILYSYASFSMSPKETREQFIEAIKNA